MRTTEKIYQEMLGAFRERSGCDLENSCDLAVRLYAVAAQVQALECQTDWVLNQSFPQTAQGVYLDDHAAMRGIARQEAEKAVGMLRFSVADAPLGDLSIPLGSVCMTEGEMRFRTTQAAVLAAGDLTVEVPAEALEGGKGGNVAAGSVTVLAVCPVGITGCTNPAAFTGGTDAESDGALRARVLASFQRLPNGANAAFYEEQALRHEGVAAATAIGRARGIGTVDVYIATAAGAPDSTLLAEVRKDLQAKREIAVDVQVLAPVQRGVNVTVELDAGEEDFVTVKGRVESAVAGWFTGKLLGKPVLLAELGRLIYAVDGVKNYHILSPAADAAGNSTTLPKLGTLTVTEMGS
ncbi:MAG: baseplate J/gp47 family protein [Oscillibacter ruminantium]|mgnify:FL=1|uniref:baseplate J/gp47 family protein n=1 Tax=Oscillibacter ruminantium TaxID=1263547 RepID=UPI002B206D6D|nr:baseplate J/gp47 family protein [Oscillibacter ruminantium]MEA5041001.1 baseplate J/gp47 family protein [Oscillibacter ruminantium]